LQSHHSERRDSFFQRTIRPERIMALGFLCVILVGTILLGLPISTTSRHSIGVHDALFTATSAVCVTGLVVVDTGTVFSLFGKLIVLLLIQIGGLGFMIFATLVMIALGRRISLRNRMLIRESMNTTSLGGLVRLTKWFSILALLLEFGGACLLSIRFIPLYGTQTGILMSVFHAVSAFCNAGFDLFGNYASLSAFQRDPMVLLTVTTLIILGGLGFFVLTEFLQCRFHFRRFSLHTKLVLVLTGALLVLGMVLILALEWDNPETLGNPSLNFWDKLQRFLPVHHAAYGRVFHAGSGQAHGQLQADQRAVHVRRRVAGLYGRRRKDHHHKRGHPAGHQRHPRPRYGGRIRQAAALQHGQARAGHRGHQHRNGDRVHLRAVPFGARQRQEDDRSAF